MIYLDYFIKTYIPTYRNTAEFFLTHVQKTKNVAFAKTLKSIPSLFLWYHTHDH